MARRISADAAVGVSTLEHLTKEALRAAFPSCADDHAAASVLRAQSSWSSFFDFLVAEDLEDPGHAQRGRQGHVPLGSRVAPAGLSLGRSGQQPSSGVGGREWPEERRRLPEACPPPPWGREAEVVALGMGSLEGTP